MSNYAKKNVLYVQIYWANETYSDSDYVIKLHFDVEWARIKFGTMVVQSGESS